MPRLIRIGCCVALICLAAAAHAAEVVLEQIVSREHPSFNCSSARLALGRNGVVHLVNGIVGKSFLLRISPDGSGKVGGLIESASHSATANADGVIAAVHSHFGRNVTLYDQNLKPSGSVGDFRGGDDVGWDGPAHVEVGASGDFYVLDQHHNRIVRVSPTAKVIRAYELPARPENVRAFQEFRVSEKDECFYLIATTTTLRCAGFDGKERWTANLHLSASTYEGTNGGIDVDDQGLIYFLESQGTAVKILGPDSQPVRDIPLQMGDLKPTPQWTVRALRVRGNHLFVKRRHPTEMFQRYDLASGSLVNVVVADHERLAAKLGEERWIAGQTVPFEIQFTGPAPAPQWRVWIRPLGTMRYTKHIPTDGKIQVPSDFAGFYHVKVTPEVHPWQHAEPPEYRVQTVVEVRSPHTSGSAAVMTDDNRVHFGRGEEIPFTLIVRGRENLKPLTVRLVQGEDALAEKLVAAGERVTILRDLTRALRPGAYELRVDADGLTCVPQPIEIGPGVREPAFHTMVYGDYTQIHPDPRDYESPDIMADYVARLKRMGFNLVVERLGSAPHALGWHNEPFGNVRDLRKRLEADPQAIPLEKFMPPPPMSQKAARYGAEGIQLMAILMANDAGLPIDAGLPYDNRSKEQVLEALTKVATWSRPFAAFRGWTWSSNWWIWKRGADSARNDDEKVAYAAALKRAQETGAWDPILEEVSNYRLSHAVTAQELFKQTMQAITPGLVTAVACPFRHVDAYPPITLSNVDEVDLQAQWEQLPVPFHHMINVDFYKRPGKRAWGHPEVWNDDGTGGQIVSVLLQMAMRGADGVGTSGATPHWNFAGVPDDGRVSYAGIASTARALNTLLAHYGNWLTTLQNNDRVAIVASPRMFKTDHWHHVTGLHFARVFEAYISCLHAHHPASIVFADDLKRGDLKKYAAVLIVGQRVDFEPRLLEELRAAQSAGVKVLYDGTCRAELVANFSPLGISFDKLEKDPNPAGDDSAYWRFRDYANANAPAIAQKLDPLGIAPASVDEPQVLLSERKSGAGRYLWIANNTVPELDPGHLWRVNLAVTSRVPLVADLKLHNADGKVVYDVFAAKQVSPQNGLVKTDLRDMPARLYAILPASIDRVELETAAAVTAGSSLKWSARVETRKGRAVDASVPLLVRLIDEAGGAIDELATAAGPGAAQGSFTVPLNAGRGVVLEARELLSGLTTRAAVKVDAPKARLALNQSPEHRSKGRAKTTSTPPSLRGIDELFGPHVRDIALIDDRRTAVLNTFNWDHNLYALEVQSGTLRWRQRVGDYFSFDPQSAGDALAVQGFDLRSAEGYHLYTLDREGQVQRRFALYGLPLRMPGRFVPGLVRDRINNFACAPDGSWIASAGDLGLAVWSADGKLLWQQDWWKQQRHDARLAAVDNRTLLVIEGVVATAYDAASGSRQWQVVPGPSGDVTKIRVSADGRTCALLATTEGGRVFVLRDGKLAATLPTAGHALALAADASSVAVLHGNLLKLYDSSGALRWLLHGDDVLRNVRISPDGSRVCAGSETGTLYVLAADDGSILLQRDLIALPTAAWLDGGDLLVATWMGNVYRLDGSYNQKWHARLAPEAADMRGKLLGDMSVATTRIESWSDAKTTPVDTTANLLTQTNAYLKFVPSGTWGGVAQFVLDPKLLIDGIAEPPPDTWIEWNKVGFFSETSPFNCILIDTFHKRIALRAVTFVEDAARPESWLRDASLEYWDPAEAAWKPAAAMLSDAPVHTHELAKPVEASRFRIVLPKGLVGNLRLAEIMFHGEVVGPANPDAAAQRPVAVLFDENLELKDYLNVQAGGHYVGTSPLKLGEAFSGGHCLTVPADGTVLPRHFPPFGHDLPAWDLEIVEDPQPGQYRYLQFAWKASPQTKGLALRLGVEGGGSGEVYAGSPPAEPAAVKVQSGDVSPQWQLVQVDLWELFKRPVRVRNISLLSIAGPADFDQILLRRLPPESR